MLKKYRIKIILTLLIKLNKIQSHKISSSPTPTEQCQAQNLNEYIWPLPQQFTKGNTNLLLASNNFQFIFKNNESSPTLETAFQRYKELLFDDSYADDASIDTTIGMLTKLEVIVENSTEFYPQIDTDESYTLEIPDVSSSDDDLVGTLSSRTIYGALRGLETFSQLISFNYNTEYFMLRDAPWYIYDYPRFTHRGVMIDTSRHYLPIKFIKRIIDSMVYAKFNVLHLHLSDSNSFPFQIKSHVNLSKYGAYSARERYTQQQMLNVIEYARIRGIMTMVEFDVPGHSSAMCKGEPLICPSDSCTGVLDVSNNYTFKVLRDIFQEASGLFPYQFMHLGGDEVDFKCWDSVAHVRTWLDDRNYTAVDAYKYFIERVQEITFSLNRRPVHWVEVFDNFGSTLDKRTIIHVWKGKDTLQKVVEAGYNAILSNHNELYLDHLTVNWTSFYLDDPMENITDKAQRSLIYGGQVEMWGETVDGSDIENTIWPRAAAFAERLWSNENVNSLECAKERIAWFRCLLLERGVGAAPVSNSRGRDAPPGPGGCYVVHSSFVDETVIPVGSPISFDFILAPIVIIALSIMGILYKKKSDGSLSSGERYISVDVSNGQVSLDNDTYDSDN